MLANPNPKAFTLRLEEMERPAGPELVLDPDLANPDLEATGKDRCWSRCGRTLLNPSNTHWVGSLPQCSSNYQGSSGDDLA